MIFGPRGSNSALHLVIKHQPDIAILEYGIAQTDKSLKLSSATILQMKKPIAK